MHEFDDLCFPAAGQRHGSRTVCVGLRENLCCTRRKPAKATVLGLASVATRDLEPWDVYAGAPAVKVKQRNRVLS